MSALLDKAIAAIRELPEAEQDVIAREMLERVEADAEIERRSRPYGISASRRIFSTS